MFLIFGTVDCYKNLATPFGGGEPFFGNLFGITKPFVPIDNINKVFNFNTLIEGVEKLDALNPYYSSTNQVFFDDLTFDSWYINYLTTSPSAFKQIVDLMRHLYNGENVYILCEWNNEIAENMIEALIKFITDSYGYKCNIAKNANDIYIVSGTFSTKGIQLFDRNMETYIKMFGADNLPSDHGSLA